MRRIAFFLLAFVFALSAQAKYHETIQNIKLKKDLVKDFGLKNDNATTNQSPVVQKAIDELAAKGGGILTLPAGTYDFHGIYLKSNVHLLVDKDVIIKPSLHNPNNGFVVFQLTVSPNDPKDGFIENISIRCQQKGEYFTIDYSHVPATIKEKPGPRVSARAFKCCQVRNFLIEGLFVKDNWTTHCAGIFVPAKVPGCNKWEVYKPTAGLIRNFKSINSSPGYGLTQLHGGYDLHFENLSTTNGGITFRLETGAGGWYGGVDQITAENIYCENGATAMAMGPHTAQNGMVKAKNIRAVSCTSAFQCGPGFNDGRDNSNKPGRFANGCLIENIHAVYGENAPIATKAIGNLNDEQLKKLWFDKKTGLIRGPSIYVAHDKTSDSWSPIIRNVTFEGFPKGTQAILVEDKKPIKNFRTLLKNYPVWNELPEYYTNPEKSRKKKVKKH